jgi:hypothetical protein
MPIYSTLQEALVAGQLASRDYKGKVSGGPKIEAKFVQKKDSEIKPVEKPKVEEPKVIEEDHTQDLLQKILAANQKLAGIDVNSAAPAKEPYREPPSLIKGLAVVKIDESFTKSQVIKGASKVQQLYGKQNEIKPIAELIKKTKSKAGKVVEQALLNVPANLLRHPIVSLQNSFLRDPIENRDILFSTAVNELVQKTIFPDNPELALTLPDDFIRTTLEEGKKVRNRNVGVRGFHELSDLLTSLSPLLDSQQRRALDELQRKIKSDPQGFLKDIEERNLKYSSDHAQGFALTLTRGDKLITEQTRHGNSQILLPGETRKEVTYSSDTDPNVIQTTVKDLIKPYVSGASTLDSAHKKQLIKEVTELYKKAGYVTDEDIASGKKIANNVLSLIDDLTKDPEDKGYYLRNWDKLQIVSYLGESKGEAQGGQERFFTLNQEIAFKMHLGKHNILGRAEGALASTVIATGKTAVYLGGYLASYGLGVAKGVPRTAIGSAIHAGFWPLGPIWSGVYGGMTEAGSDINTKFYKHESRVTQQLRQVSREKSLRKSEGDTDFVRSELEEALVTALPASEITDNINKLVLHDPNNWNSETRENLTPEEVTGLLINIANAQARLRLSIMSGSKDINYKTQNWLSYKEGQEQQELTNLKAANLQAFFRLKNLQDINPALFTSLPLFDVNGGDLEKIVNCYSAIIQTGLLEGLPIGQLENSPLKDFKSKRFYKQIFEASGVDESEVDNVETFLTTLKNDQTVVGGKKIYEWMDESESLKARMKDLNRLKWTRGLTAGATAALSSAAIGEAKHLADKVIAANQPHSPDNIPPPSPTETTVTLDFGNYFKVTADGHKEPFMIWNDATGKVEKIEIPVVRGFDLVQDKNNHIDLVGPDGKTVFEDVFVFDSKHGALAPNANFKLNDKAPPVDLGTVINFKVEQKVDVVQGGQPVELTGGAAIVEYLKTHYRDAMSEIAHRDVYKGEHALTTFVDSDGKIHITQGGYSAPNITGGGPQSMTGGLENGDGALWFTFGKNADRPLSVDSTPLSFEGIKVPLTWHEKGNGGYGEFVFDPLHPNPNSPQEVLLAKLIDQNALNEFKTMGPNHWLNQSDLGRLWMGVRGYEGGYMSQTPDGPKMHDFEMEFAGENNKLVISPPESTTITEITSLIPPTPVEVKIPSGIPVDNPEPLVPPTPPPYTPIPVPYYSPQLKPTEGEKDVAGSSTPLPKTTIDEKGFKKEVEPRGYNNQEAKDFLEHLAPGTGHEKINEFIEERVLNETQREFMRQTTTQDFIRNNIYTAMHESFPRADAKIHGNNDEQLTEQEKTDLKRTILEQAKTAGLSEQEALTVNTYLVNRSYLTALGEALIERRAIEDELKDLNEQLVNASSIPVSSRQLNSPPKVTPIDKDEKIDQQINDLISSNPEILKLDIHNSDEDNRTFSMLIQSLIEKNKLITPKQVKIMESLPEDAMDNVLKAAEEDDVMIFRKLFGFETMGTSEKDRLLEIILKTEGLSKTQANVFFEFLCTYNSIAAKVKEKIPNKPTPTENEGQISGEQLFDLLGKATVKSEIAEAELKTFMEGRDWLEALNEPEYNILTDAKTAAYNEKQRISQEVSMLENKSLPEIFGLTAQQSVGTREAHDAFYPLRDALIEFEIEDGPNSTGKDKQQIQQRIFQHLNEFIEATTKDGLKPRVMTFAELIANHHEMLANIRISPPSPSP